MTAAGVLDGRADELLLLDGLLADLARGSGNAVLTEALEARFQLGNPVAGAQQGLLGRVLPVDFTADAGAGPGLPPGRHSAPPRSGSNDSRSAQGIVGFGLASRRIESSVAIATDGSDPMLPSFL